jgi:hypothetical protein
MTSTPSRRAARTALPATVLLLVMPLVGCAAVVDALRGEAAAEFDTRADLVDDWGKAAPWLPADATDIVTHESTEGDPASLRAVSATALNPAHCVEVERESAPMFTLAETPDVYKIDRVYACGDWAVVATDDGWYGWTPNDPDERAQSPAS